MPQRGHGFDSYPEGVFKGVEDASTILVLGKQHRQATRWPTASLSVVAGCLGVGTGAGVRAEVAGGCGGVGRVQGGSRVARDRLFCAAGKVGSRLEGGKWRAGVCRRLMVLKDTGWAGRWGSPDSLLQQQKVGKHSVLNGCCAEQH
jgi:hypothetical protein